MEQKRDTNLVVELRERMHNQFDRWINHEDLMRMEQKRDTNLVVELRERMHNQFERWIHHEKLKQLQKEFGPGYKITCEGRVYVGDGEVWKLSRENKKKGALLALPVQRYPSLCGKKKTK